MEKSKIHKDAYRTTGSVPGAKQKRVRIRITEICERLCSRCSKGSWAQVRICLSKENRKAFVGKEVSTKKRKLSVIMRS